MSSLPTPFESPSPFFTTSRGALFAHDCIEFLESLNPDSLDTVFADPPFNIGKDYKNGFNDDLPMQEYLQWSYRWLDASMRALKPGGAIFVYAIPELAIQFGSHLSSIATFRHWIAITMKGTFVRGRKLYPAHYALLYYTKGQPRVFHRPRIPIPTCRHCGGEIKDYGGHRSKLHEDGINLSDFWDDTSPNRHAKFKVRPGVNELKLVIPERAILISTDPGDIVFDPFGGGGSTYQAAEKNERRWIGTELYDYEHIKTRMAEEFPESVDKEPIINFSELFH